MFVGGAIINGLAFSGSNYLFSKLSKSDEAKRHYEALENYKLHKMLMKRKD